MKTTFKVALIAVLSLSSTHLLAYDLNEYAERNTSSFYAEKHSKTIGQKCNGDQRCIEKAERKIASIARDSQKQAEYSAKQCQKYKDC